MIPPLIVFAAFGVLAAMVGGRTYTILAVAAFGNLIVDQFTSASDLHLMVVYSVMDFVTAATILWLGDRHQIYQSTLICVMICYHMLLEMDQVFGTNVVFDWYEYAISFVILAQLLGARYGADRHRAIFRTDRYSDQTWPTCLPHHQAGLISQEQK